MFPTHSFDEAGVKLIFSKNVQVQVFYVEEHSRLDHGDGLLQPIATGNNSQVHGGLRSAVHRSLLPHDVPAREQILHIMRNEHSVV